MDKPKKKLAELTQTAFPFRKQSLLLYEDRLELRFRGLLDRFRIPFYLHVLKEEPDQTVMISWRSILLGSAVLAAGLALALLAARPSDAPAGWVLAGLGAAGLSTAILMIRRVKVYFYKSAPGSEFSSPRYVPQLWLYLHRPSSDEVKRFEELLRIARERQVEKARIEQEDLIPYARELERFANLRREKVVTEEEYALVKAKLLNLRPRRIGF